MASKGQIVKIHTLISFLGFDDDVYRDILSDYRVKTSTDLSFKQAGSLINRLEEKALQLGGWNSNGWVKIKPKNTKQYDNLGIRDGMATPVQLRKIEGMWFDVTRQGTRNEGLKALKTFLQSRFGIVSMDAVTDDDVKRVVRALTAMKKQADKGVKVDIETDENGDDKPVPVKVDKCKVINIFKHRRIA